MQGNPAGKTAASPEDLGLTGRQLEVLALMMQGKSNKAICRALDMAEQTVKKHVTAILKALKANNRTEAVVAVGALGWQLPQLVDSAAGGTAIPSNALTISTLGHTTIAVPQPESLVPKLADPPRPVALALPEKPSIVVLPFANLSGDPGRNTLPTAWSRT
jgi:DNA-binding CsgD family transcriptional regulator